jgi:hypothetical protein
MPRVLDSLLCCFRPPRETQPDAPAVAGRSRASSLQGTGPIEGLPPRHRPGLDAADGVVRPDEVGDAAALDGMRAYFQELEQFHRANHHGVASAASVALASTGGLPVGPDYDRALALEHHPELTAYLDELEQAYRQNRDPIVFDHPYLDDILRGLNAADPALAAQRCEFSPKWDESGMAHSALVRRLQEDIGTGRTARLLLDSEGHRAALSIRCVEGSNDVSIALVDSFSPELMQQSTATWGHALGTIAGLVQAVLAPGAPAVRVHLMMVGASTQKTLSGCSIFALSALKKMASEGFVDRLHEETLQGMAGEGPAIGVQLMNAKELPASFMKHATSGTVIDAYLGESALADPAAAVNHRGETLRERHDKHVITRGLFTYSNSFEVKRIEFVRTALHHLTAALIPEA